MLKEGMMFVILNKIKNMYLALRKGCEKLNINKEEGRESIYTR